MACTYFYVFLTAQKRVSDSFNCVADSLKPENLDAKDHNHLSRKLSPLTCIGPPGDCVWIDVPSI